MLDIDRFDEIETKVDRAQGVVACIAEYALDHDNRKDKPSYQAALVAERYLKEIGALLKLLTRDWQASEGVPSKYQDIDETED